MNGEKVLIGLSGGINSMAVLCNLVESGVKPSELYLFYAHFDEHSPDTYDFVLDGIAYAQKHFDKVFFKITYNSVLDFFEDENLIPHPAVSVCSRKLKIDTANAWAFDHNIKIDLVGYVKNELKRRAEGQKKNAEVGLFSLVKHYPIGSFTDAWCFEIVDRCIGWHPAIYDIVWTRADYNEGLCNLRDIGKRVFKHNNCLPCKNMHPKDMQAVKKHYPVFHVKAMELSAKIGRFWGRDKAQFYATFGRDLGQDTTCEACKF